MESAGYPLDDRRLTAYTCNMSAKQPQPVSTPCLCNALRQASRAVSRLYDEELRGVGLRTTQYLLAPVAAPVRRGPAAGPGRADAARRDDADPQPPPARGRRLGRRPVPGTTAARSGSRSPTAEWRSSKKPGPRGSGRRRGCRRWCRRRPGRASWRSSRRSPGSRPGLDFFGQIDAYTGFCRGQRLAASWLGGAMATQLERRVAGGREHARRGDFDAAGPPPAGGAGPGDAPAAGRPHGGADAACRA